MNKKKHQESYRCVPSEFRKDDHEKNIIGCLEKNLSLLDIISLKILAILGMNAVTNKKP